MLHEIMSPQACKNFKYIFGFEYLIETHILVFFVICYIFFGVIFAQSYENLGMKFFKCFSQVQILYFISCFEFFHIIRQTCLFCAYIMFILCLFRSLVNAFYGIIHFSRVQFRICSLIIQYFKT